MRKLLVVLGVPVDNLTMEEALDRCDAFVAAGRASGRTHQIATVNADFVVNSLHDPELQRILQEADMATADGMPLVWGSRLLGGPLPGRVTGADMVPALAARAAQRGYSIFFLGAREGIAAQAAAILQERNPGLQVAGVLSPPPRPLLEMDRSVLEAVQAARPDILLVAFGNPKQEKWIRMHAHELRVPICIGVGGTFDMIVGVTKRAPAWVQKIGMEWAYRLSQEPQRLAKRYLHDFGYFGYFFARQWWGMRRGTAVSMAPGADVAPPEPPQAPAPPEAPAGTGVPRATPVLYVQGRLEASNQSAFAERASHMIEQSPYLIISMAQAVFLDSSALGALVGLANKAKAAGGALWVVEVPPHIQSLLALVRLDSFFEIYSDAAAAEAQRGRATEPAPTLDYNGWSVTAMPRIVDGNNSAAILERCLAGLAENPRLVIDFSETAFMASAGMAALIKIDRAAQAQGGALRVVGCSPDVLRTLSLVRLDSILTLMPDVAAATGGPQSPTPGLTKLHPAGAGQP